MKELIARVARRFMPRLKTESEVATMAYIREHTSIPVPEVYHYDANPYNRLGGEYILMSKAPGVPLSRVYHSMGHGDLVKLLENIASLLIPLFSHRFNKLGSLYFGPDASTILPSAVPTPKASQQNYGAFPFAMSRTASNNTNPATPKALPPPPPAPSLFHVGPIISWPFFGSNRGELSQPREINRGPWPATHAYFLACAEREVSGVVRENEGKSAPHKLHLDPAEIRASRHHHLKAVPGDESDESDDWDLEESEEEWEGPGDAMYRDYRRMQRSTFLVAHLSKRVDAVKKEMARWTRLMERLVAATIPEAGQGDHEEFGLDLHDLSLENVFVDEHDNSKISCIIDWESTTTRPLWACAHLPAFLQSSPFIADLFREAVAKLATSSSDPQQLTNGRQSTISALAREWLHYESMGVRLRMAHRFVEWDGWEEGLIDSILGPEEDEDNWFKDAELETDDTHTLTSPTLSTSSDGSLREVAILVSTLKKKRKPSAMLPCVSALDKEQVLTTTGDICGGRGGELGRRLEAWLSVTGSEDGDSGPDDDDDDCAYDAEAE
jgi:hypothetical protein